MPKLVSLQGSAPPYSDTVAFCLVVSVLAAFVAAAAVVAAEERPDSLAPAAVAFAIFPLVFVLLAVCVCIPSHALLFSVLPLFSFALHTAAAGLFPAVSSPPFLFFAALLNVVFVLSALQCVSASQPEVAFCAPHSHVAVVPAADV